MFKSDDTTKFMNESREYLDNFPKSIDEVKILASRVKSVALTEAANAAKAANIYSKVATGDATIKDINQANRHMQDLFTLSAFTAMAMNPISAAMLPAVVKSVKDYDSSLLPASIVKEFNLA